MAGTTDRSLGFVDTPRLVLPGLRGIYDALSPLAYPLIRFWAGFSLVPHGAQKLFGMFGADPAKIAGLFEKIGFVPGSLWVTASGTVEFVGGLLVAFGLLTRPAAVACAILLAVTISVQSRSGWFWSNGGMEYSVLWTVVMIAIVLRGGDRFSIDRTLGREF